MTFRSGNPVVDRYIAEDYESVRGMSSRFAATICAHVIRRQSDLGIEGHFAEIGTFEGRFFIAMALGLGPTEKALGIDTFDWPDAGLIDRFHRHCARLGLDEERYITIKAAARDLPPDDVAMALGGPVRFWHIDGDHTPKSLSADLDLAVQSLHPKGILCLDDMLHPGYPLLIAALQAWLDRHPEMRVLAVIDREDIVAAAKVMICREDAIDLYGQDLVDTFPAHHWKLGADWGDYFAVVLTPKPRLATVE
ncbi:class I SAM-dependent methyltransferase [Methylobacterium gnaphalii]|uniref:Class I SAM-dependent methyltransferase n=1 Tax=Methylobacterium gnaphalii TaxID=1010610 RepID=A0A512JF13_9HYPH|nr:class I SAM-dependent methyltransferase [Methylobacterium gnaphalii]GEP08529.1 hypothetical protein MGN01_03740 [Methylobacterium gnaphalii]GJD69866.1 hypothetical protein MMMDOFMJ_2805 [Methylobacterium gnaphalii]GLS49069.1 hypothetical protein GCM10007885_19170 [Methylobacterium gnaphalii]